MIEVLHFADSQKGACFKYRVALPIKYLNRTGLVHAEFSDRWEAQLLSKIHLFAFQRNSTKEALQILYQLREKKRPIIYDIDDDILHIPESNPVYGLILHNPGVLVHQLSGMRFASVITVTCPALKRLYEVITPNVRILPNCVDLEDWANVSGILKRTKKCRIFWGGSPTHDCDLDSIRSVLKRICEDFGKSVEIVFMGIENKQKDFPVTQIPGGEYEFFQSIMSSCDIGIAPMADNPFNLGKSDLRLKELGMAKLPIVASQVGEYDKKESGALLCKTEQDWYHALSTLINDKEKRKLSAKESRAWAETWDIKKHIHLWQDLYEEMTTDEHERGSAMQVVRIQSPKRPTRKVSSGTVRVGGNPHDRNSNASS